ncbi:MAG: DUF1934 domain-containing protein [Oscillospiraceae bacterium]|jgi:hypothetical protein|nr:DUF1934 domain-containing protein [Oscillospiraceae bacterium]
MPRSKDGTPVRVALDGAQTVGGQTHNVRLLTEGRLFRKGGGFTLVYSEIGVDPGAGSFTLLTKLTCGGQRVSMERSDPDRASMIFDRQGPFACQEGGQERGGDGFRLIADDVRYSIAEGGGDGRINLSFSVMGSNDAGRYNIDIHFEKRKPTARRRGEKNPAAMQVLLGCAQ